MLSNSLTSASALVLCLAAPASAQQQLQARKVLGPVKDAGIYHVDVSRDMADPDYRRCILLPCHQDVTDDHLDTMERILN